MFGAELKRKLASFPVVTILGPRQSGKTTFAGAALGDWTYVDCERPRDAAPLEDDPEGRITQLGDRVIFDEAQRIPGIFPVLRGLIDRSRRVNGRFLLLGSVSPGLIREISETLAGRTSFLQLPPLRLGEVAGNDPSAVINSLWFRGGYPDAYLAVDDRTLADWFDAYVRTFVERDLPAMGVRISVATMRRMWAMLAHLSGSLWNASKLGGSLGVNYQTVNRYVDILEQAFLVRRLHPYTANISKRLVKSPKMYMRDSGLLHHFLGIGSPGALEVHPARGPSWESFVIEQMATLVELADPRARLYHWRTSAGAEVDLLIETGRGLIPFEIKLHAAPTRSLVRGLVHCMADLNIPRGYVIYPGDEIYPLGGGITVLPAGQFLGSIGRVTEILEV